MQNVQNIKEYVDKVAFEFHMTITGINKVIRNAWYDANDTDNTVKERHNALSIILNAYNQKVDMLGAAPAIQKALENTSNNNTTKLLAPMYQNIKVTIDK